MPAFITNASKHISLKKRITELIENSEKLKFLVGFFYFSGLDILYESLKNNPNAKMNILVGLNVDKNVHGLIEYGENTAGLTNIERFEKYLKSVSNSLNSEYFDKKEFYLQVKFFLDLIENEKIIIRKTKEPNHAKLYIFLLNRLVGPVLRSLFITGSSNLTKAGLLAQGEFNVEIKDYGAEEAEEYFDNLWDGGLKITEHTEFRKKLIDLIRQKTLITEITPFEAYALVLKTYIDLQDQKEVKKGLIDLLLKKKYRVLKYQLDAVSQALTIVEHYNGVMVCDVVGLGKSIIAGMIARSLGKRGVIICPPGLIGDPNKKSGWEKYKEDFHLHDWEIRSCGLETLQKTQEFLRDNEEFEIIIIDEAHRFRNQDTEAYEALSAICRNKTVILLTATPFNNSPADIFSMLKLFIVPGKSSITLDDDLVFKFVTYSVDFKKLSYIKKNHSSSDAQKRNRALAYYESLFAEKKIDLTKVRERSRYISKNIRQIIEPVLIRRNRIDLKNDPEYSKEVYDLSEVKDPVESFFELTKPQSHFYNQVIGEYFGEDGKFTGAVYRPFVYETGLSDAETEDIGEQQNREALTQKNLYDFMRRLLVKRFESSFGAFRQSICNFESITQKVLKFIQNSGGKYILDRQLIDKIYELDIDEIEEYLGEFEDRIGEGNYPKTYKVYSVETFKRKDDFVRDIEADQALFTEIKEKLDDLRLVDDDPKFAKLVSVVRKIITEKSALNEPTRKVVIFTEYQDTAKYLEEKLEKEFPEKILTVGKSLDVSVINRILENFDAAYDKQKNDYQILLATDKVSEGFNLNRAGAVINYDIPWNPTRVIQRVGRINRIGKMVFRDLYIHNFFPTEQGATIVKSRQIAADKMFLIHNTLGEDAKIFDVDEEPTAAGLFKKVTENPEAQEEESFHTTLRRKYFEVRENHPETIERISAMPPRVKVAKKYSENGLLVFIKKNLGFFARGIIGENEGVDDLVLEDIITHIECQENEPRGEFSPTFWDNYRSAKDMVSKSRPPATMSLETKALNNIKTLLNNPPMGLDDLLEFAREIRRDLIDFNTLSEFTLRRIANLNMVEPLPKDTERIRDVLAGIRERLGDDYLRKIEQGLGQMQKEVIIAIENVKGDA